MADPEPGGGLHGGGDAPVRGITGRYLNFKAIFLFIMGNPMLILNFDFFQLQVGLQANVPQPQDIYDEDDDVDTALNDLQVITWLMFISHYLIFMFYKISGILGGQRRLLVWAGREHHTGKLKNIFFARIDSHIRLIIARSLTLPTTSATSAPSASPSSRSSDYSSSAGTSRSRRTRAQTQRQGTGKETQFPINLI